MTYTFFTINSESDEEEYSSFVELEEFEDDDEVPEGFEGLQKGSELEGGPSDEAELPRPWESSEKTSGRERAGPVPWDPAESFFAYL